MKRTIVVADRDEKVQQAFMTIFSREQYAILWARNGREVEKLAAKVNPDIYLVNVNLPKMNGIEVQKTLQKHGYLDKASFFFLKDESDTSELLGCEADGIIEKPINFFRVYETLTGEDEVIELTDLVEEKIEAVPVQVTGRQPQSPAPAARPEGVAEELPAPAARPEGVAEELPAPEPEETKSAVSEEAEPQTVIGRQLRQAMDTFRESAVCLEEAQGPAEAAAPLSSELEQQLRAVLNQAMKEAADKLSSRLAPVLTRYVEDYVKQMLLQITEKVIREEIDKLLKESIA